MRSIRPGGQIAEAETPEILIQRSYSLHLHVTRPLTQGAMEGRIESAAAKSKERREMNTGAKSATELRKPA